MKFLLFFGFTAFLLSSDYPTLTKEGGKNLNRLLTELFPDQKVKLQKLPLNTDGIADLDILNADGRWFSVRSNGSVLGWLETASVWGRYREFEYVMVVDTSLQVMDVSVLSYFEKHGNAVCNRNWLGEFRKFNPGNTPEYGRNVDALSGATISGTSLTESVSESLLLLKKLKEGSLLN